MRWLFLCSFIVLTACQTGPETPPVEVSQPDPAVKARCESSDGTYRQGGIAQQWICFRTNPDAGTRCDSGDDCRGFCMAGNHSCSATTPMFGCHSILGDDGKPTEICID